MSLIKLYKNLQYLKTKNKNKVQIVTNSTLSVVENKLEIDMNGIPSSILINFSGIGTFESKLPLTVVSKIGKSTIIICNVFKEEIPKLIFEYSGNIQIYNCFIMNFDGSKIVSDFENIQNEQLLNQAKTNMEDDTLILYDEPKVKIERPFPFGLEKKQFTKKETMLKSNIKISQKTKFKPLEKASQRVETSTVKPLNNKPIRPPRERASRQTEKTNNLKYEGGK